MTKVIQVRGVSDQTHERLTRAAAQEGMSLSAFLIRELADVAKRIDSVEHNRRVIEQLRAEIGVIDISREESLRAIDEARAERDDELDVRLGHLGA